MTKLRPYQEDSITGIYHAIKQGYKKPLLVLPPGGGKSTITSRFTLACLRNNKRLNFLVHKEELVLQFHERLLNQFGIHSGIIKSKIKPNRSLPVQVSGLATAIRRKTPPADVLVIDEAHRAKANSYKKIIDCYPDSILLGLTATPFRGDGKGLNDIFDCIVNPIKTHELIKQGYLVGTKVYIPENPIDLSGIALKYSKNGKDYDQDQLFQRCNEEDYYQRVVDEWKEKANGMKTICFNIDRVEHSKRQAEQFVKNGISAVHLDGKTPDKERRKINKDFKEGKILIICNCSIISEGYDVPDTECVILNRATKSFGLYIQMVGRAARIAPGKTHGIILDIGQNTLEHGFFEDYDLEDFTLKGRPKKGSEAPMKRCPNCGAVCYASSRVCKDCSYTFPFVSSSSSVEIGSMVLLNREQVFINRVLRKRWDKLKPHELRSYCLARGYKRGWYYHKALESECFDVDPASPASFREIDFLLSLEEQKRNLTDIVLKLKSMGYEFGSTTSRRISA